MSGYEQKDNRNTSLNLMSRRLGVFNRNRPQDIGKPPMVPDDEPPKGEPIRPITDSALVGVANQEALLRINGGPSQQERMIFDKRRTLDRAVLYSYQGALVKNILAAEDDKPERALINPNKNKVDYDDKVISIPYEYGMTVGDVFEWIGTKTYWLIYLQDLTELAYFRGDIRRCSYEISWEDEDGLHSTYAAIRGPVETKIDYIQKHQISIDTPNHSLHILMPRNKDTLTYFQRYSKFYLQDPEEGALQVCWRVEATDWISTPGILEVTAVEYYANESEDDVEKGLVGSLITKPINPNSTESEYKIAGDTFIKPHGVYTYKFRGLGGNTWTIDTDKYPVQFTVNPKDDREIHLTWTSSFSGQFEIKYGNTTKTIVVESLF